MTSTNMEMGGCTAAAATTTAEPELVTVLKNTLNNLVSSSLNVSDETLYKIIQNIAELAQYILTLFAAFKSIGWTESTTLAFIANYLARGEGALCENYKEKLNFSDADLTTVLSYISKCKDNLEFLNSVWQNVSDSFYVNLSKSFGSIMGIMPSITAFILQNHQNN